MIVWYITMVNVYTGILMDIQPRAKEIICFKFGSEYESGGAGCISTVDDYIKFLEALRTGKILKEKTIKLLITNQLSDSQRKSYVIKDYGYGLGVRCPMDGSDISDFGWGGAAGSYLIIDIEKKITAFYAQHVVDSPVQTIRQEIKSIIYSAWKIKHN